jgi:hypothetical protein
VSSAWGNYVHADVARSGIGSVIENTLIHAAVGGVASVAGGGSFGEGAETGAFDYLFNELQHYADYQTTDDRLRQGGYLATAYPNGAVCNGPTISGCTAGTGTDEEVGQAAMTISALVLSRGTALTGLIQEYGLEQLTTAQLNAIIADAGGTAPFKALWGSGLPGAQASLANPQLVAPGALTADAAAAYRVMANRAIAVYVQTQNTAGILLQTTRLAILTKLGL